MKGFNCPNCGKRQDVKLTAPSQATVVCSACGRQLFVRMKKNGKWSIDIDEPCIGGQHEPQPQMQT